MTSSYLKDINPLPPPDGGNGLLRDVPSRAGSYMVSSGAHDIIVVASNLREALDKFLLEVFRRPTAIALGLIIRIEDGVDTWFVTTERAVRERGLLRE